jgi:DNA-3-methyladenine glycosylase
VYLIYGNHFCLNVSCLPADRAGCVLVRALEPVLGIEAMQRARGLRLKTPADPAGLRLIASGPGRLTQALNITRERDNGKDLTSGASDLRIVNDGFVPRRIARSTRIGISKGAEALLRYVIAGNAFISGKRVP